jgi:hypothetical protein
MGISLTIPTKTTVQAPNQGSFRRIATSGCVALSVLFFLLVLTEFISFACFRIFQSSQAGVLNKPYVYKDREWARAYWSEFVNSYRNQYKSYIVWRRAPFSGKLINVDENGNRRTVNPRCSQDSYNIWMFGSSVLWGTGVSDEQTIPSLLSEKYAGAVGPVCITNFGETGFVNTQEVVQLMLALKHMPQSPALVIFYDGTPDAFAPFQSDKVDVHGNFERIREQVEKAREKKGGFVYLAETNTARLLKAVLSDLSGRQSMAAGSVSARRNIEAMVQMTVENYLANMRVVETLSSGYGFQYVSIWGPTLFLGQKPLTPEERALLKAYEKETPAEGELFRRTYDALFAAGNQHIVNAEDMFDHTAESLYLDLGHTGPAGDRIAAARIFEILRQRGLLNH